MKATELKAFLAGWSRVLKAAKAKGACDDIDVLNSRIVAGEATTSAEAIAQLESELTAPPVSPVEGHLKSLQAAGLNEAQFDRALAAIDADKRGVTKAVAVELLKAYAGQHARAKSRPEAIHAIRREFAKRHYDAETARQAASTPW